MLFPIFVLISFFLYYLWQRRNLLRLAHKLKGLHGYPIVGSAYKFLNADRKFTIALFAGQMYDWMCWIFDFFFAIPEILHVINDFHKKFGGPGKFWLGNRLFVYIDDPKHFEMILNAPSSLNKGDSYDFISESVGLGLITLKCISIS